MRGPQQIGHAGETQKFQNTLGVIGQLEAEAGGTLWGSSQMH